LLASFILVVSLDGISIVHAMSYPKIGAKLGVKTNQFGSYRINYFLCEHKFELLEIWIIVCCNMDRVGGDV